ncbi:hypothetical protein ACGYLO_12080 [Sulfitobacter sp. 1A13353]|uniref:hypothetical protein n=1 Tax=Sulfitobacter sp. 1A13353 TaxID=3368568 RepID=UPI003745041A
MAAQNVTYFQGVTSEDRVTIFVPPGEFDAHITRSVYEAELFTTDMALIIRIKGPVPKMLATELRFRDAIVEGKKEIWISHLHPEFGYILDQARLDFTTIA